MVNLGNVTDSSTVNAQVGNPPRLLPTELTVPQRKDSVELGTSGPLSQSQVNGVVLERAFAKLQAVVSDARAQLGLPEDATLDTSPDATANRIADFALGFFSKYAENNGLEDNEEGRAQYAAFIGGAIDQGISEAREILTSLNALNGDATTHIDQTADAIQQRLDDFVANGLG